MSGATADASSGRAPSRRAAGAARTSRSPSPAIAAARCAWSSRGTRTPAGPPSAADPCDRRKSDLDLVVRGPDGSVIPGAGTSRAGQSASNIEWLDFVAPETGTYTAAIEVARWDCDLDREPVGFAWIAFRAP